MQFVKDYTGYTTLEKTAEWFWYDNPDSNWVINVYASRWFPWDPRNRRKALNDSQLLQDVDRQEEIMDKLLELYPNLNQTSSQRKVHELIEMCAQEQMQIFIQHWFQAYTHLEPSNGVNLTTSFPFQIIVPSDTLKPTNVRKICVILGSTPKWTTPYEPWRSVENANMPSFCSSYFFKPTKKLYEDIIGKFGQNQFPTKLSVIGEMSINEIIMIAELKTIEESKKEISDIFTQIALCLAGYNADGASAINPTQLFANVFERILIPAYYREESEIQRHSDSGTSFDAPQFKLLRAAHDFVVATQLMPECTVYKETMITEHKNTTNTELLNCLLGFVHLDNKDEFRNQLAEHGLIIPLENEWLFSGSGRTRTANYLFFGERSNTMLAYANCGLLFCAQVYSTTFYVLAYFQLLVQQKKRIQALTSENILHQTPIIKVDGYAVILKFLEVFVHFSVFYKHYKRNTLVMQSSPGVDFGRGIVHICQTLFKNKNITQELFLCCCLSGYAINKAYPTYRNSRKNPILDIIASVAYIAGLFIALCGIWYSLVMSLKPVQPATLMRALWKSDYGIPAGIGMMAFMGFCNPLGAAAGIFFSIGFVNENDPARGFMVSPRRFLSMVIKLFDQTSAEPTNDFSDGLNSLYHGIGDPSHQSVIGMTGTAINMFAAIANSLGGNMQVGAYDYDPSSTFYKDYKDFTEIT